eukprot:TRINITY_DN7947_c0_g1_i1.p1 TRINITY_DN7947_c0_g1~~TRINITY_DN7947_c0_g1_i1.p1  ORF type:complete len:399 (+),score=104.29 TRINITY_DN7947_c0_g1_i1:47-1198(+)
MRTAVLAAAAAAAAADVGGDFSRAMVLLDKGDAAGARDAAERAYSQLPAKRSLGRLTKLQELPPRSLTDLLDSMWRDVERKVAVHPGAKRLAGADIWLVPNVLPKASVDALRSLTDDAAVSARTSGRYCFDRVWEVQPAELVPDWNQTVRAHLVRSGFRRTEDFEEVNKNGVRTWCVSVGADEHAELRRVLEASTSVLSERGTHPAVDAAEATISATLGLDPTFAYWAQLLRYPTGGRYGVHTDCTVGALGYLQRTDKWLTTITYLQPADEGGGTTFPLLHQGSPLSRHREAGVTLRPGPGDVIVFRGLDQRGLCDMRFSHVAEPAASGVKYVLQKWWMTHPVDHRTLLSADDFSCDGVGMCRDYVHLANLPGNVRRRLGKGG